MAMSDAEYERVVRELKQRQLGGDDGDLTWGKVNAKSIGSYLSLLEFFALDRFPEIRARTERLEARALKLEVPLSVVQKIQAIYVAVRSAPTRDVDHALAMIDVEISTLEGGL